MRTMLNQMARHHVTVWRVAVVGVLISLWLPLTGRAQNLNPKVLPPSSTQSGLTYGEWSARWWQWVMDIPAATNPLTDVDGRFCSVGQSGRVWFLAGSFGYGDYVRGCTVPTGRFIFVPLANAFCAAVPFDHPTGDAARACAAAYVNHEVEISGELDGVPLQGLNRYRFRSPIWDFTLGPDNVLGAPAGFYPVWAADGTYVMFTPLSPGAHTLQFRWHLLPFFDEWNGGPVTEGHSEVTYRLVVR